MPRTYYQSEGYSGDSIVFERFADLRYRGENTELTVPVLSNDSKLDATVQGFGNEHERTYGYQSNDEVVVVVNLRLIARGLDEQKRVPEALQVTTQAGQNMARQTRSVYFGPQYGRLETRVVDRTDVTETGLDGPLIIEEYDSTTVVPPGCHIQRDAWHVLRLSLGDQ